MKSLMFVTGMILTMSCLAQKTSPPVSVQAAFRKAFPGIIPKSWDKEDGKFEANFTKEGKRMSATFEANGSLEETEMDIAVKELPAAITSYVQQHYKGTEIKEAAIITKPNGEKMYEAEVKGKDLMFDIRGKFLKAQEEKDEKDEKDEDSK